MVDKPKIFISCGQATEQEKQLGKRIANLVEAKNYKAYFAENVSSLQGLTTNIFAELFLSDGFITVIHDRGQITHSKTGEYKGTRGSVWIEQEIAIAAFMESVLKKNLKVQAFIQNGVCKEGVRDFVQLNPIKFDSDDEILDRLEEVLNSWQHSLPIKGKSDRMEEWIEECDIGWKKAIEDRNHKDKLPTGFECGYWTIAYQIADLKNEPNLADLKAAIAVANPNPYQSRSWFYSEDSKQQPYVIADRTLEYYANKQDNQAKVSVFWRTKTDGSLFLRNGYIEDVKENEDDQLQSEAVFFLTTPALVIGHALKQASQLASRIGKQTHKINCFISCLGMQDRKLVDRQGFDNLMSHETQKYICRVNEITVELIQFSTEEIDKNIATILLSPMRKIFDYFNYFLSDDDAERLIGILADKHWF